MKVVLVSLHWSSWVCIKVNFVCLFENQSPVVTPFQMWFPVKQHLCGIYHSLVQLSIKLTQCNLDSDCITILKQLSHHAQPQWRIPDLIFFLKKPHEIEKYWPKEGSRDPTAPLDPPVGMNLYLPELSSKIKFIFSFKPLTQWADSNIQQLAKCNKGHGPLQTRTLFVWSLM